MVSDLLSQKELQELLSLAKETVISIVKTGEFPKEVESRTSLTEHLKQNGEVFVTLKSNGSLRGCIGTIEPFGPPTIPLYKAIMLSAKNSAIGDPRFLPVSEEELPGIEVEISVLTPRRKISSVDEIQIGRDGIVVEKNGHKALFLPQVPVEWNWDLDTYLSECCRKAGLPANAWKSDVVIYTFMAQVYS